ncbi:MAG: 8-oxo-dGTP diphosphatase [Pseudonocardiales bacterium]|jgi:ADP-ribose pyrophosphatase YjhB (NUDIX family)|nr:8-oxo-dGTP diphosphatase [Pseudonocardiales bacterium]
MLETATESGTGFGGAVRRVYVHDSAAPVAAVVTPSVFVAARDGRGRLLLVRRSDSGAWELPGGRVDVGESALHAAVRETAEESGVQVRITGLVGLFTDPAHVVVSPAGEEVRQQFVVCLHARAVRGTPVPDMHETVDASWFEPADVAGLVIEPGADRWITWALSGPLEPHLD